MRTRASPVAGWYGDPESPDGLRFWDGAQWTDDRRGSGDSGRDRTRGAPRRRWLSIAALGVVLIVLVAVAVGVVAHRSSSSTQPAETVALPLPAACTYPEPRPSASDVLWWFGVHQKLPSAATPQVRAKVPTGGCSAATFRDKRVKGGTNVVIAMASPDRATALAQSLGAPSFANFDYVIEVDPRDQALRSEYQSALAAYVGIVDPPLPPGVGVSP